jgi:hypothetical protein
MPRKAKLFLSKSGTTRETTRERKERKGRRERKERKAKKERREGITRERREGTTRGTHPRPPTKSTGRI